MKKTLILITALFAGMTHASTIQWGSSGAFYFGTTKVAAGVTGYLVALGSSSTWAADTDYAAIVEGTAASIVDTKESAKLSSKVVGSTAINDGEKYGGYTVVDGSTYFGSVYSFVSEGTTYYNVGEIYKFDTNDATTYDSTLDTFSWRGDTIASNSSPAAQGWVAVPEPSTAALALAGLALLLKRRKA